MLVWPLPTRVTLSWSMARTRYSPNLSPTKSVLPASITDGRMGLKTIACNLGSVGLGGGVGAGSGAGPLTTNRVGLLEDIGSAVWATVAAGAGAGDGAGSTGAAGAEGV